MHKDGTIRFWDISSDGPSVVKCVKVIESKLNCNGMKIDGVSGLERKMRWTEGGSEIQGSVLQFLLKRGAVIDKK